MKYLQFLTKLFWIVVPGREKRILLLYYVFIGLFLLSCKKNEPTYQVVESIQVDSIVKENNSDIKYYVSFDLMPNETQEILSKGVCFSKNHPYPNLENDEVYYSQSGVEGNKFEGFIDALSYDETYYFKGFIKNTFNVVYSEVYAFELGKGWRLLPFELPNESFPIVSMDAQNPGSCWVVGYDMFQMTIDSGANWSSIAANSETLNLIDFSDENNGMLSSKYTYIDLLKSTSDGGNTWVDISSNIDLPAVVTMDYAAPNTFYFSNFLDTVFATYDGGQNWVSHYIDLESYYIASMEFVSPSMGFVLSTSGKVYKTSNSGYDWIEIGQVAPPVSTGMDTYHISVLSESVFIASVKNKVYKSVDGGASWYVIIENDAYDYVKSISFANETDGLIVIESELYRTYDAGENWVREILPFPAMYGTFVSAKLLSPDYAYLAGEDFVCVYY